jgi:4-carboxymuconolactone decarboxylase
MRLSPIDTLDDEQTALLHKLVGPDVAPPPPFFMWAHNLDVAHWVEGLGDYCRTQSRLNRRLLVLSMLMPGRVFTSGSMWNAHYREALGLGFTEHALAQLGRGERPDFANQDETVFHAFAEQVLAGRGVDEETYAAALALLGEDGLLDALGCLGSFSLSSMALNAFQVAINPELGWPFTDVPARDVARITGAALQTGEPA